MSTHFRLGMAIFWGIILSFVAVESALACNPETEPCHVIFTLDEANNMVLQTVEDSNRTEGILRLTLNQAEKAATGPVTTHNILKPAAGMQSNDEFAETIKRLAAIPGLHFLADPAAAEKAAKTASGQAGEAMALSGAATGHNKVCAQMHLVMKATLADASNTAFDPARDYITAREVEQACGKQAGAKMIQWYEGEQVRQQASF